MGKEKPKTFLADLDIFINFSENIASILVEVYTLQSALLG